MANTASGGLETLLPTIGSTGDVHPVIELGNALQKRGHKAFRGCVGCFNQVAIHVFSSL